MQKHQSIMDFLLRHADRHTVSFHMPGHKGSDLYRRFGYGEFLDKIMDCDITEIPGADNLFQAEGIIKTARERYRDLYEVLYSYLLINGTSGGIIASILATVPAGGKLIMARNSHKSVFNALTLGNIRPVYAYPELIGEFGISGEISCDEIEKCLAENPDASAVILPSPNYYGVCSDISAIAEEVHRHGKVLIVDQAHGAHLKFFKKGMPAAAEDAGADIVINSIHKTLASFTQSAVLNLNSGRVDRYALEDKLQCIQSTSPSYLLMASLDIGAAIMEDHGETLMNEWSDNLDYFYREATGIQASSQSSTGQHNCGLRFLSEQKNFDRSKINIDTEGSGMTAAELEELLMEKGIFCELTSGNILMLMSGIGNKKADFERLISALKDISEQRLFRSGDIKEGSDLVKSVLIPKKAEIFEIPKNRKRIALAEADGCICAVSIIPYPPGIPLICPGEKLQADTITCIKSLRASGQKVIGINEKGEVTVGV